MQKQMIMKDETKAFLGVAIVLGSSFIANMTMIYFSAKSYDGLVEENYYLKGLNYQSEIDLKKKQKELGWNVEFLDNIKDQYTIKIKDKDNKPISKAMVKISFFRPSKEGFDKTVFLKEVESGTYQVETHLALEGFWSAGIEIKKDNNIWKMKKKILRQ